MRTYFHYFCATRESRLSWSSLSVYYESPSAPHVYSRSNNTTQTRFHKSCTICKYPRIRGRTGIWEQSQSRVYVVHWRSWAWRKLHDFVNTRKYVQIVQLLCNTVCSIRKRRPWWKKKKTGALMKKVSNARARVTLLTRARMIRRGHNAVMTKK